MHCGNVVHYFCVNKYATNSTKSKFCNAFNSVQFHVYAQKTTSVKICLKLRKENKFPKKCLVRKGTERERGNQNV